MKMVSGQTGRFALATILMALLVVLSGGAVLAEYELPQGNPFAPNPGADIVVFNSGIGYILATLFGWAAKNIVGPALVVLGAWRLFEVLKEGIQKGEVTRAIQSAAYIVGGVLLVLLVSSGNWYDLLRSIWGSISQALSQISGR